MPFSYYEVRSTVSGSCYNLARHACPLASPHLISLQFFEPDVVEGEIWDAKVEPEDISRNLTSKTGIWQKVFLANARGLLAQAFPFDLISAMLDNGLAEKRVFTLSFDKMFEFFETSITIFLSFSWKNESVDQKCLSLAKQIKFCP